MKIIVTGSLGHISKPLTEQLLQNGHTVTVITSNPDKQQEIEVIGATAAIGSLNNPDFLTATFTGADAVYTMVPPADYFDQELDLPAHYHTIGHNYATAIAASGVKQVVNLSTIGAHLEQGSGILIGAHDVEQILNKLPAEINIVHMRPTSFYYNLLPYIYAIKANGVIAQNYGAESIIPWVSPTDIAQAIFEELEAARPGRNVRYVASEELSGNETAKTLGAAIGLPDLKWVLVSSDEVLNGLIAVGMNERIAAGLVEMYGSLYNGLLAEDYNRNKPAVMGKVKLADFAKEFATVYYQK
ncbi:NAD(P)H-binding protein [Mucilaginibacter glaciei]|uniref:NAD(P)H-binding protein n=1 Tax=Mucilaginibacter glaciei TaxID=2772109 RepID=A0A926NN69_9SPHI|nr:NAD(P)H-binding protein [Mucilaginibacter glaciei]MBD1391612.1 NAD(P)H-binding protein [Mucilaginibacter glaciei]